MKLAVFVLGSISLTIQFYAKKYHAEDLTKTLQELEGDHGIPRIKTFDFIVVGGGSAGCVLAGRLSEKFNVLLLEAGGNPVPMSNVPFFTHEVSTDSDTNFLFKSVPQPNASLSNGGILNIHTGKMLGGSGSHNDMVHNRGSPLDFDNYARITNDESWNYANVLEYFKKSENFIGELFEEEPGTDYYGKEGPLTIDTEVSLMLTQWFAAAEELGFKVKDPNGYQAESFTPLAKMIDKGKRVSSYLGYIKPFRDTRENLTIMPYSVATQVLIDQNKKAYGVAYSRHGIPQIAHASKEVMISTGTFVSPILLMQSGVGPEKVLQEANIPVKLNLPSVGQNLADHVFVPLTSFTFNKEALPYFPHVSEAEFEDALKTYLETGAGIFGELQEGPQAFLVSSRAKADGQSEWPDSRVTIDTTCPPLLEDDKQPTACAWVTLDRAKSKGFVTLNTTAYKNGETDLTKLAVVEPQMLQDASDIEVLLEAIKFSLKIIEDTNAFKLMGAQYSQAPHPNCSQHQFRSDNYWRCYIKQRSDSAIHMVGTCGMGQDSGSVTDSKFRVRGVTNLRVVDASVLPVTPNANINAPIIMLAEKAADEILKAFY